MKTLLLLVLLLAGCANWEGRRALMRERFYGKPVDEVIRALGVPRGRVFLTDGSQVVEFITYRGNFQCEDQFTTDPRGIVVSSRHGGENGCAIGTR